MKKPLKIFLAAIAVAVVFGAIILFVLPVWSLFHETIEETRGPVTREKALKHCIISLPESARDVQYAWVVGGMQYTQQYVRFEAPVDDCYAQAKRILRTNQPTFSKTSRPLGPPSCEQLHTKWFDVDKIAEGVVAGDGSDHGPQIWIDTQRGVFYYYLTD
jgi:hypothetical protein